jgi:hypothetical protein
MRINWNAQVETEEMAPQAKLIAGLQHMLGPTAKGRAVAGAEIAQDELPLMGVAHDSRVFSRKERVVRKCEIRGLSTEHSLAAVQVVDVPGEPLGRVLDEASHTWLLGRTEYHHPMLHCGAHVTLHFGRQLKS